MFKLVNNMEIVNFSKRLNYSLNTMPDSKRYNLRRNSKNLVRENIRNFSQRFDYFTNRVVSVWNKLPEEIKKKRKEKVQLVLASLKLRLTFG